MIYSLNKYNILKPFQYWVDKGVKASLFFEWISVIDAIPKEWRSSHFIKTGDSSDTSRMKKKLKITIGGENSFENPQNKNFLLPFL